MQHKPLTRQALDQVTFRLEILKIKRFMEKEHFCLKDDLLRQSVCEMHIGILELDADPIRPCLSDRQLLRKRMAQEETQKNE